MSLPDNFTIYGVLSTHIDKVWDKVLPFLQEAINYSDGEYSLGSVYKALKELDMQLWVVFDGRGEIVTACVTTVVIYPLKKVMWLLFCGGVEMNNWLDKIEVIKQFAKDKGCHDIKIHGREGWTKKLATFGAKRICTVYKIGL